MLLNLKFLILDKMSYLVVQIHIYWSRRINPKKMSIHLYQICHWQVSSIGTHNRYAHFDHRYQCGRTEYVLFRHYSTLEVLKYQMKPRIYKLLWCVVLLSMMDIADQIFFVYVVLSTSFVTALSRHVLRPHEHNLFHYSCWPTATLNLYIHIYPVFFFSLTSNLHW